MKLYRDYYFTQDPAYLDQYPADSLKTAIPVCSDPVWQSIDNRATYTIIKNYIEKKKETIVSFYFFCLTIFPT